MTHLDGPVPYADRTGFDDAAVERVARTARRDLPLTDDRRRLGEEAAAAIADAGFARHFVPRRHGGRAGTFSSLLTASASVAETCLSTAWCATLYAAHGRLASYLPEEGRRALWKGSPDTFIAASIMPPQGEAVRDRDGWRISGRWDMASGVHHADWLLLASRTAGPDGPEHRIFALPRHEGTVLDTWRSLGMRGTGSNAVEVAGSFVPAHLSFTLAELNRPQAADAARCHRVPYLLVGALMFATPIVGAAQGALDAWRTATAGRARHGGAATGRRAETERVLTESSAQITAARLLLERAARRADQTDATPLLTAENRRDAAMAVTWCAAAAHRLFGAAGSRAHREDDPLQRHWRDITTAASHGALGLEAAATGYAEAVFGTGPAEAAVPGTGTGEAASGTGTGTGTGTGIAEAVSATGTGEAVSGAAGTGAPEPGAAGFGAAEPGTPGPAAPEPGTPTLGTTVPAGV
ncbi:acyl-CoA dehydrogenase family protein [Streptomyces sediminimaris]|uniref:acyl-CoA dehydrogenase family protein n=1 Tax=Streptomyces sediminimaris TaxID=3383721 RepID=UPI00399AFE66